MTRTLPLAGALVLQLLAAATALMSLTPTSTLAHGGICADDEYAEYVSCNATVAAAAAAAMATLASLNSSSAGYANATRAYWCGAVPTIMAARAQCVADCVVNSEWDSGAVDAVAQCRASGWEAKAAQFGCAANTTCCSILTANAPSKAINAKATGCTSTPSGAGQTVQVAGGVVAAMLLVVVSGLLAA